MYDLYVAIILKKNIQKMDILKKNEYIYQCFHIICQIHYPRIYYIT